MKVDLEVKGLKELEEKLVKELPAAVAAKVLRGALVTAASVVRKRARELAPRGTVTRTGPNVKKNQRREPGTLRKAIAVRGEGAKAKNDYTAVAYVGFLRRAYYGLFIELGTSKMRARPFLRPALDQTKEAALDKFRTILAARIEKAAAKGRGATK